MYKRLIEYISELFLMHIPVRTLKYQSRLLNNSQSNDETYQVYIEDVSHHRLNITTGIFVTELSIWILSQPIEGKVSILDIQDTAMSIANSVINRFEYSGAVIHDYDVMTVSHVTDDDSAGVRLTLMLDVAMDGLCDDDQWREEPYEKDDDDWIINVDIPYDMDINLKRKRLERVPVC